MINLDLWDDFTLNWLQISNLPPTLFMQMLLHNQELLILKYQINSNNPIVVYSIIKSREYSNR